MSMRRAVVQFDPSRHLPRAAADEPHRRRQPPLRVAEESGERGGEERFDADRLGGGEVRGEHGKGAPGEGEPGIAVQATAEELEVVRHGDEWPRRDEGEQPEARAQRDRDADAGCGGRAPRPASADEHRSRIRVWSGRPLSSSSACAATPMPRKNASRPSTDHVASAARAPRRSRRTKDARACTADAATSRSRASPRARARRRRGARCRSRAAAPRDDPTAEAEPCDVAPPTPAALPELEQPLLGPARVEVPDARAEEVADLGPAGRDHAAGDRQPDADVELPERPPDDRVERRTRGLRSCRPGERRVRARATSRPDRRRSGGDT